VIFLIPYMQDMIKDRAVSIILEHILKESKGDEKNKKPHKRGLFILFSFSETLFFQSS